MLGRPPGNLGQGTWPLRALAVTSGQPCPPRRAVIRVKGLGLADGQCSTPAIVNETQNSHLMAKQGQQRIC